ncbi:hypothetical protein [Buttiauxella sp. S04-F03]|uniref:hypothetical protein n=1 Tax=Buttiauxella sp. S04-F03 TaxID=2904525 RepID=UPI001E2D46A1|nr:hypothetical protein [Buttiauxella sp. S04-F03]MCE0813295.1 hypothetical protein [Buttiauxella sp. S04-F03]
MENKNGKVIKFFLIFFISLLVSTQGIASRGATDWLLTKSDKISEIEKNKLFYSDNYTETAYPKLADVVEPVNCETVKPAGSRKFNSLPDIQYRKLTPKNEALHYAQKRSAKKSVKAVIAIPFTTEQYEIQFLTPYAQRDLQAEETFVNVSQKVTIQACLKIRDALIYWF